MDAIHKLWALLGKREKRKFLLLFVLMIVAALLETVGIGLIVPFVGLVTNPDRIENSTVLYYFYEKFNFHSTSSFIILVTVSLFAVFVVKNVYLVGFYYVQYRVIFNEQVNMSKRLFQSYMTKPYTFYLQRNSAQLLRNTNIEVQRVFKELITPLISIFTESLVILFIFILLMLLAPLATVLSGIVLGLSAGIFFRIFRNKLKNAATAQLHAQGEMIKWVQEGLGAVKEVRLLGREKYFVEGYTTASKTFANARRFYDNIRQIPRLFIETIVVATILMIIVIVMLQSSDLTKFLATISLFTMAAFRLTPSMTRLVNSQNTIRNTLPSLEIVYQDMFSMKEQELQDPCIIINDDEKSFVQSIEIDTISFGYPEGHERAIVNISLSIPIGKSIAFVGPSGSGKSTLIDIILGILEPDEGRVTVDGNEIKSIEQTWKRKIGYVPQFIYLSDDTIRHNIAFGVDSDQIDDAAIWQALTKAQLHEYVNNQPKKLDTWVGERGVRLSGGQRQRIGIARALYHNPEILFMDEATSALDQVTEDEIMKAIDGLKGDKTLIIIAHRLSTIKNCDIVFQMDKGRLV